MSDWPFAIVHGKIPKVNKPHIYPKWYPKAGRIYWRVSVPPLFQQNEKERELWRLAYCVADKLNAKIQERIYADITKRSNRKSAL